MNRISELRREKHMTQTALAIELNVTQNMVSFYESGKNEPSISTLINLSKVFGVSVDYIIGNSDIRYTADSIFADKCNKAEAEMLKIFKMLSRDEKQRAIGMLQAIHNL